MPRAVSISIKSNRLPELSRRFPSAVRAVVDKTVMDAKAVALQRVPVDTGRLKNSISTEVSESGDSVEGVLYTDVEYGPYQEFGTRRMSAQPFFRPAFESVRPGFLGALSALERSLT